MVHALSVPQFNQFSSEEWFKTLLEFNVRHVEQQAAVLKNGLGRIALEQIGAKTEALERALDSFFRANHGISFSSIYKGEQSNELLASPVSYLAQTSRHKFGYAVPSNLVRIGFLQAVPKVEESAETQQNNAIDSSNNDIDDDVVSNIKNEHYILSPESMLNPRDQSYRGTCVAFTCISMLELMIRIKSVSKTKPQKQYSPQYLYYWTKRSDPNREFDGTTFSFALDTLKDRGVCEEGTWTYEDYPDWEYRSIFRSPPASRDAMDREALNCRITGYKKISPPNNVLKIKRELLGGKPVGVGLLMFDVAWYSNPYTENFGEVQLPLTRKEGEQELLLDECIGAHAVTLVGYKDNSDVNNASHRPGGGYFVFKNSWGTSWAKANHNFREGYGILPYEYVKRYCREVVVITDVEVTS